jgi:hypothetical protein
MDIFEQNNNNLLHRNGCYPLLGAGDFKTNKMAKDLSFVSFFRPAKSQPKDGSGIHQAKKRHGRLVWDSSRKGTYVRALHGELK